MSWGSDVRSVAVAVVLVALSLLAIPVFSQEACAIDFKSVSWTCVGDTSVNTTLNRLNFVGATTGDYAWAAYTDCVEHTDYTLRFQFNLTSGGYLEAVGLYQVQPTSGDPDGTWKRSGYYWEARFMSNKITFRYNPVGNLAGGTDLATGTLSYSGNELTVTMICSWMAEAGQYSYGVIVKDEGTVLYSNYAYYNTATFRPYNYVLVGLQSGGATSMYVDADPYLVPPEEPGGDDNASSGMELDYVIAFIIVMVPSICMGFLFGRFGLAAGLAVMSVLYFVSDPTFAVPMFISLANSAVLLWGGRQ